MTMRRTHSFANSGSQPSHELSSGLREVEPGEGAGPEENELEAGGGFGATDLWSARDFFRVSAPRATLSLTDRLPWSEAVGVEGAEVTTGLKTGGCNLRL